MSGPDLVTPNSTLGPSPAGPPAPQQPDVVRLAAMLVIAAVIVAALYLGRDILIPLAIAFLISFALGPLVNWVVRRGLPRIIAVFAAVLLVLGVLGGLGTVVTMQVRALSEQLPTYQTTIRTKIEGLGTRLQGPGMFDGALQTVDTVQEEVAEVVGEEEEEDIAPQRVRVIPEPVSPFETAMLWLSPLLAPVATAGIVLVFVVLILLDQGDLRDRLLRMLGGNLYRSTDALEEAGKRISKYLLMQLLVNVSYGIPMALGLWLIGVPGWILWGTLAAVMRFIPYVGPILSAVFPLSLAFAVDPGWNMVLFTLGLILVLELVSNNVVEPLLYGSSTGLSAISLIAAATFWTAIWGPVGLVLSTPLTVCLLVIGRYIPQLSVLETLLGSTPALDLPTRIYQRLIANDPDEAIETAEDAIETTSVTRFYSDHGMEVLRQASADYLHTARAEHRLRIATGMDALLDSLREDHPAPIAADAPPQVVCVAGKWDIDRSACEMLAHSLRLEGIAADERAAGAATTRYVDGLELDRAQVVLLSYFSREPDAAARNLARRIRRRWPGISIVIGLWGLSGEDLDPQRAQALGADAVVASIDEAVLRIERIIGLAEKMQVDRPDPQTTAERAAALADVNLGDPDLREDLDDLAKRAADVFDVRMAAILVMEPEQEVIVGQNRELRGIATTDGRDLTVMPPDGRIAAQVAAEDGPIMVADVERDPRFADSTALRSWSVRALTATPVRQADEVILGALCLMDDEIRTLDDDELRLLQSLAAEVAERLTGAEPAPVVEPPPPPPSAVIGQKLPE
ncbi:AI-2E family transporter [uncultured Paracoccus sp.]|uniref:AI-2E family transporter n=1 Tax=uncultured Paracoccus sp. TaxID=189685 RepID=UPI00261E3538|nr:AI-2E family transporter [uncultured Paracoccus sp.]